MLDIDTTAEPAPGGTRWFADPFTPIAAGLLVIFLVGAAVLAF